MSVPQSAPTPEKKTPPLAPVDAAPRRGTGRLWGIVDLVLLLAIAVGAAFYVAKETFLRHNVQIVDRPSGPLTQIRDTAGASGDTPLPASGDAPALAAPPVTGAGDVPVKVETAQ